MKDIPGYEGLYAVNRIGDVYSYRSKKYLKHRCSRYPYVSLVPHDNPKRWGKNVYVHVLVAKAFVKKPTGLRNPTVNHKNGVKTDPRDTNLEWISSSDNQKHAYANGLKKVRTGMPITYISDDSVRMLRSRYQSGETISELCRITGIPSSTLRYIVHYKRRKNVY